MTAVLRARLLGGSTFTLDEQAVASASRKGVAMLALLSVRPLGLRREELAELLWGSGKLASVRQALYELRKLPGTQDWLIDDNDTVRVAADCDVTAFEEAVTAGETAAALDLYRGELLAGFQGVNVPAFLDWLVVERDRLAMLHLLALQRDAERLEDEGSFAEARVRVQEAMAADPLNENLYRGAMRLAYVLGDVEGATELYRRCARMVRQEFDSEPSRETRELAGAIERGEPLAVSADLNTLPLPRLRLLQALAIGGGELGVEGTAKVIERPSFDVATDLSDLEAQGLVDAHVSVTPRYLAQVLASTPMSLRRLLHERTAEVLVADPEADEAVVGRHLLSAGNGAAAAPRFLRAARVALDRSDLPGAVALLFRTLWAVVDGAERLEACILLEGAASQTGDEALQDAALAEAERLAWERQSDPHLAEVRMRRSRQHLRRGRTGEALELALEALAIGLRLGDDTMVARARNAIGGAHFYAGDLDGAVESFASNLEVDDPVERFRAHNNLGTLAAMRGDLVESYRRFDQALTLARASATQAEVAATLNNLAATAERLADYPLAVRHFRDGLALARRNQAPGLEGQLLINLAVVYTRLGHLGPAWNTMAEVEEMARPLADQRLLMHAAEQQAEVLRVCGMEAAAITSLERAVAVAEVLQDERKCLALRSQLAVLSHIHDRGGLAEAEGAIEALATVRLADIAPWLWIELALSARTPAEVARFLERTEGKSGNRHLRLIADLARLRAALLAGVGDAEQQQAEVIADRLNAVPDDHAAEEDATLPDPDERRRVGLQHFEVVERPYAWWLLCRWQEHRLGTVVGDVPTSVTEALQQQGEGLPKPMRASLMAQPDRWQVDLDLA